MKDKKTTTLIVADLKYLHEVLLFQRMLDTKHRNKIDEIRQKILEQIETLRCYEKETEILRGLYEKAERARIAAEDKEDKKYRRKIVNE